MQSRRLIAQNLKRIRLLRRKSQEALAFEADVDRTYLSDLERGVANPSADVLDRLSEQLSVKTIEFFAELTDAEKPAGLPRGRRTKAKKRA